MMSLTVKEIGAASGPQEKPKHCFHSLGSPQTALPRNTGVCLFLPFPGGVPEDFPSPYTALWGLGSC